MAEHETKDIEKNKGAMHSRQAQNAYNPQGPVAEQDIGQFGQVVNSLQMALDTRGLFAEQRSQAVLELQRTHGNKYVQRMAESAEQPKVDENIMYKIEGRRGRGRPLEPDIRSEMEDAFQFDFSQVMVHVDTEADSLSQQLGARAFTTDKDIFFRRDAYHPDSESGRNLLAHELAHVTQQTSRVNLYPADVNLARSPVYPNEGRNRGSRAIICIQMAALGEMTTALAEDIVRAMVIQPAQADSLLGASNWRERHQLLQQAHMTEGQWISIVVDLLREGQEPRELTTDVVGITEEMADIFTQAHMVVSGQDGAPIPIPGDFRIPADINIGVSGTYPDYQVVMVEGDTVPHPAVEAVEEVAGEVVEELEETALAWVAGPAAGVIGTIRDIFSPSSLAPESTLTRRFPNNMTVRFVLIRRHED